MRGDQGTGGILRRNQMTTPPAWRTPAVAAACFESMPIKVQLFLTHAF
jgi:hypothetical protein